MSKRWTETPRGPYSAFTIASFARKLCIPELGFLGIPGIHGSRLVVHGAKGDVVILVRSPSVRWRVFVVLVLDLWMDGVWVWGHGVWEVEVHFRKRGLNKPLRVA